MTLPDGRGRLLQLRRDTVADWDADDPVLEYGEPGWDGSQLKIGDGTRPWGSVAAAGLAGAGWQLSLTPVVGQYFNAGYGNRTTGVSGTNSLRYAAILLPTAMTLDRIGVELVTPGGVTGVVRLGVYEFDPATSAPGALVLDAGTVSGAGAAGLLEITIDLDLAAGWHVLASVAQGGDAGVPVWRVGSSIMYPGIPGSAADVVGSATSKGWIESGVAGALPAVATPAVTGFASFVTHLRRAA